MRWIASLLGATCLVTLLFAPRAFSECARYEDFHLPWVGGLHDNQVNAEAMDVSGNIACFGVNESLLVVDVSTPGTPTVLGFLTMPIYVQGVAIFGHYVLVELLDLRIVDIADPRHPREVAQVPIPFPMGVAFSGTLAYVSSPSGLYIVDLGDPAVPFLVGMGGLTRRPEANFGLTISGRYLFAATERGVAIYDLRNPRSPTRAGMVKTQGQPIGIAMSGNYAYVTVDLEGFRVVDVSDPTMPRIVGSVDMPDNEPWRVALYGRWALVTDWSSRLKVIDVADPANPRIKAEIRVPGETTVGDVAVRGNYAFLGGWAPLDIFEISGLGNAPFLGSVETPGTARGVALSGDYACVADDSCGLQIIKVGDARDPRLVGNAPVAGAMDVAISGTLACVIATAPDRLEVVDISAPWAPLVLGTLPLSWTPAGIAVAGSLAYVGVGWVLHVVDLSNPRSPRDVGTASGSMWIQDVAISGACAFLATSWSLDVMDISNPANPQLVRSLRTPGWPTGIETSGQYAYLSEQGDDYGNNAGLDIFDIADPRNPVSLAHLNTPRGCASVAVLGRYVYLGGYGITVVDVADPANPHIVGNTDLGDTPGIAVSGNALYAGSMSAGLRIFPLECDAAPRVAGIAAVTGPAGFGIVPNPTTGRAIIRFRTAIAGGVSASIFDVAGRRVRDLGVAKVAPGTRDLPWDGRDDAGHEVAAGVYLVRLSTPEGTRTARLALIR